MGTCADFYIGRGEEAEWVGSVGLDGHPKGVKLCVLVEGPSGTYGSPRVAYPTGRHLFDSTTREEFLERLEQLFKDRSAVQRPQDGWPWPWWDSSGTDYTYAFDAGTVWASRFGRTWFDPRLPEPSVEEVFPDMRGKHKSVPV